MTVFPAFCPVCQTTRRFERPGVNHILHLLISVFTCGWWLLVWLFLAIFGGGTAHCVTCGSPRATGGATKAVGGLALVAVAVAVLFVSIGLIGAVTNRREEISAGYPAIAPAPTPPPASTIGTPRPGPPPPAPTPSFAERVDASQRRAVAAHPDLGKAGSAANLRFRVRHDDWKARGDVRLTRPDWPEVLANEVTAP